MRTLSQQVHSMRRNWPGFELVEMGKWHLVWFGDLSGIQKRYRVMIEYGLPLESLQEPMFRRFPVVRVLCPSLRPNFNALEESPLPHVYFDRDDLPNSALCLFDPEAGEWSHNDFIALTTIPWTSDWLASYECWRATGRWFAGGRHANPRLEQAAT